MTVAYSGNTLWLDNQAETNTAFHTCVTTMLCTLKILESHRWPYSGTDWNCHIAMQILAILVPAPSLQIIPALLLHLMSFQISMFHKLGKCDVKNTICPHPVSFWCFIKSALWLCLTSTACDHFVRCEMDSQIMQPKVVNHLQKASHSLIHMGQRTHKEKGYLRFAEIWGTYT